MQANDYMHLPAHYMVTAACFQAQVTCPRLDFGVWLNLKMHSPLATSVRGMRLNELQSTALQLCIDLVSISRCLCFICWVGQRIPCAPQQSHIGLSELHVDSSIIMQTT